MNKLFLKVFLPLLFLQVMFLVQGTAQTTGQAFAPLAAGTTPSTKLIFPVNAIQGDVAIERFVELTAQYGLQLQTIQAGTKQAEIVTLKAKSCKQIASNLMQGQALQSAVNGGYANFLQIINFSMSAEVAEMQEFKTTIQNALLPKN